MVGSDSFEMKELTLRLILAHIRKHDNHLFFSLSTREREREHLTNISG
jgi:hypothetical protein